MMYNVGKCSLRPKSLATCPAKSLMVRTLSGTWTMHLKLQTDHFTVCIFEIQIQKMLKSKIGKALPVQHLLSCLMLPHCAKPGQLLPDCYGHVTIMSYCFVCTNVCICVCVHQFHVCIMHLCMKSCPAYALVYRCMYGCDHPIAMSADTHRWT